MGICSHLGYCILNPFLPNTLSAVQSFFNMYVELTNFLGALRKAGELRKTRGH